MVSLGYREATSGHLGGFVGGRAKIAPDMTPLGTLG